MKDCNPYIVIFEEEARNFNSIKEAQNVLGQAIGFWGVGFSNAKIVEDFI